MVRPDFVRDYKTMLGLIDDALTRVDADPDDVTEEVINELGAMTKARILEVLEAVIYDHIRARLRSRMQYFERRSEGDTHSPHGVSRGVPEDIEVARKSLLDERFYSPAKKEYVTWGDADIEDHESYARLLRAQIDGLEENAQRHEGAVVAIRKAKVACLRDVPEKAVEKVLA